MLPTIPMLLGSRDEGDLKNDRKMKALIRLFSIILLVLPATGNAQNLSVSEILDKVNMAVLNFDQGQFTFHDKVLSFGTDKDSTSNKHSYVCFFKKNLEDSVVGYQTASFRENEYQEIYDGKVFLTLYDKKLETISKGEYPDAIKDRFSSNAGPLYFVNVNSFMQYDSKRAPKEQLRLLEKEAFLGKECYKLFYEDISPDSKRKTEIHYYISTESFLPIRTVTTMKSEIGKVQETLLFDYWVTDVRNEPIETAKFSREALSKYREEEIYRSISWETRDALLPLGTKAPDWKLPLITGGTMSLSDLKGKIVVMDFWFKSCTPCIRQMVDLEELNQKFPADKVVLLGVNTYDDPKKDKLDLFLKNRLIFINSVYKGRSIERLYNVYGAPALFVINQTGDIVFTKAGYDPTILDEVSKAINAELK